MLEIVSASSSVLFEQAKEVKKVDKSVLKLLDKMYESLLAARDPVGVGLAAPQVGKSLQIFIAKPTAASPIQVFINPVISQKNAERNAEQRRRKIQRSSASSSAKFRDSHTKLEGCLSLPNIWGEVKRAPSTKISYMDEKGKKHSKEFKGFMATIIQHEMDHLNGILFPKRVLEQQGNLYKSRKNEKGEDVFEEIDL